jgi:hypothetical protein
MPEKPRPLSSRFQKCSRCHQPIVFARTMATESGAGGKAMPLDLYPNPDGNVAVRDTGRGRLVARVLKKDEDHDRQVEQRAMPHFATCGVEEGKKLADEVESYLRDHAEGATS